MDFSLAIGDLARSSEQLLRSALQQPGPGTFGLIFGAGLLTSLGPCSLSILPLSLAYLAGFGAEEGKPAAGSPWQRSLGFCIGVVAALVCLGTASA